MLGDRTPQGRLAGLLDSFPFASRRQVRDVLRQAPTRAVKLEVAARGYLRGPVMADRGPVLWPVATIWAQPSDHAGVEVQLRLGTFFEFDGQVHACGWRFETGEDSASSKPHPYPHAQQISGFAGAGANTFLTPAGERAGFNVQQAQINEMRPCFPITGSSCVGLAVVMLATLYGAQRARKILDLGGQAARNTYREEADLILG
jgi:hypothetical protein